MISPPLELGSDKLDDDTLSTLYDMGATAPTGGMYPVGDTATWHGGVHLSLREGTPVQACAPGRVVAARLAPDDETGTCAYGHTNFILTKHLWPPFAEETPETTFYMLYMHLLPKAVGALAETPGEAPWLSANPHLRVTAPGGLTLWVDGQPGRWLAPDRRVIPTGSPTEHDGTQWQPVRLMSEDTHGEIPVTTADGTRRVEDTEPPVSSKVLSTLQEGSVAKLDVPVEPGTTLWWGGAFGRDPAPETAFDAVKDEAIANARELADVEVPDPEPIERAPTVHWEVFSETPVLGLEASGNGAESGGSSGGGVDPGAMNVATMGGSSNGNGQKASGPEPLSAALPSFTKIEDSAQSLKLDPTKSDALSFIDKKREEEPDLSDPAPYRTLDADSKKTIHVLETGTELRRHAVKHGSEWGIKNLEGAVEKSSIHDGSEIEERKQMQWWSEAKKTGADLPSTRKVWHYHPATALKALRETERETLLLDGPCEDFEEYRDLFNHEVPESVKDRLSSIWEMETPGPLPTGLAAPQFAHPHSLEDSWWGPAVNLDFYGVRVEKEAIPGDKTPQQYYEYWRTHFNSFFDKNQARFLFYPNLEGEKQRWKKNPLGTIFSIQLMATGQTWVEDGTVVATEITDDSWIFTTAWTPQDHRHPVTGNREFGYKENADGTVTFYTRGVDQITSLDYAISNWVTMPFIEGGKVFSEGDSVWENMISNLQEKFDEREGEVQDVSTDPIRPYSKLKKVVNGDMPVSALKCK